MKTQLVNQNVVENVKVMNRIMVNQTVYLEVLKINLKRFIEANDEPD